MKGLIDYAAAILAGDGKVREESGLLNYAMGSVIALALLFGIAYAAVPRLIPGAYLPLVLLAIAGSVAIAFSHFHIRCYGNDVACMPGMMAGMTMGMAAGFMVGALVGATNGMFIGCLAGIGVGIALGANLGRPSGVMGGMEGIMAGLMSGTMGPMLSVMMINDNLVPFLYVLFVVCAGILGLLSYMMYKENGGAPKTGAAFVKFLAAAAILSIATIALMLYGPKGPITYP